jgi:hypothetical protein
LGKREKAEPPRRGFNKGMFAAGLFLFVYGVFQTYPAPTWTYSNYWGGAVFAPLVVVLGLAVILLSPFTLRKGARTDDGERVRFPHEDVKRPVDHIGS